MATSKRFSLSALVLILWCAAAALLLGGCQAMLRWDEQVGIGSSPGQATGNETVAPRGTATVNYGTEQGDYYIVAPGDTLYSIAFRYGYDFKRLAAVNGINDPYLIKPGQAIRVANNTGSVTNAQTVGNAPRRPSSVSSGPVSPGPGQSRSVEEVPEPAVSESVVTRPAATPTTTPAIRQSRSKQGWQSPTIGRLVEGYASSPRTKNGVRIAGQLGQAIKAAQSGQVVYVGDGLKGYGNLIILKHNDDFISAYGFNQEVLVRKDQWVQAGDTIGRMGTNPENQVMLHFEIRQNGQPINPVQYIAAR